MTQKWFSLINSISIYLINIENFISKFFHSDLIITMFYWITLKKTIDSLRLKNTTERVPYCWFQSNENIFSQNIYFFKATRAAQNVSLAVSLPQFQVKSWINCRLGNEKSKFMSFKFSLITFRKYYSRVHNPRFQPNGYFCFWNRRVATI